MMLLPAFQDLIKPQWRKVLEELKMQGSLPISELSRTLGASYMAVKQQCEALKGLGYLSRLRVPRAEIGRPEIFYTLTAKANSLFPDAGVTFTLELLAELKTMLGENLPDKLLFQYFEKQRERWQKRLENSDTRLERVTQLVALRTKEGCFCRCTHESNGVVRIEEFHHPLWQIFQHYPRALAMELRMLEQLLESHLVRREIPGNGNLPSRVVFEISLLEIA